MEGRDRLENAVVDGRVIVICMRVLMARSVEFLTGVSWLIIGFSGDFW
jgi:hypothetical protein